MKFRTFITAATFGAGIVLTPLAYAADNASVGDSVTEYASDTALTTKIKAAFVAEKELDALDISVETSNGVTTLAGEVDEQAKADLAERVAQDVEGVKDVHNEIKVKAN